MAAVRPRAWHRGPDECPHTASKSEAIWPPLTRQITHAAVLIRKNVYLVFGMHQTLATQHLLPTTADGALGPRLHWPLSPLDHSELAAAQGPSSTQDGLPPSRPRVAPSSAQAGGRPVPRAHHGKRRLAGDRPPSLPVPCTSPSSPPPEPGFPWPAACRHARRLGRSVRSPRAGLVSPLLYLQLLALPCGVS